VLFAWLIQLQQYGLEMMALCRKAIFVLGYSILLARIILPMNEALASMQSQ